MLACCSPTSATAQTATEPNEGSRLTRDSILGSYRFTWWGQPGRTYFIQQSADLSTWEYKPLIESGTAGLLTWDFPAPADKFFLRLRSTDLPTTDPFNDDFDGDKVSNWNELLQGTDPLSAADTDANGLPLAGATIWVVGHLRQMAVANADGDFRLTLPAQTPVQLSYAAAGYQGEVVVLPRPSRLTMPAISLLAAGAR